MEYLPIDDSNRQQINSFISEHWATTEMIIRGTVIDMTKMQGIVTYNHNEIFGLVTYYIKDFVCEITSLDSLSEHKGIGTELVNRVVAAARMSHCKKVIAVTTNDNINAIRFYQKRDFDMARFYHNALEVSRKMKPEIPLIGDNNIPLRHEIEFEFQLL